MKKIEKKAYVGGKNVKSVWTWHRRIPQDFEIMNDIHQYEKDVQFKRG